MAIFLTNVATFVDPGVSWWWTPCPHWPWGNHCIHPHNKLNAAKVSGKAPIVMATSEVLVVASWSIPTPATPALIKAFLDCRGDNSWRRGTNSLGNEAVGGGGRGVVTLSDNCTQIRGIGWRYVLDSWRSIWASVRSTLPYWNKPFSWTNASYNILVLDSVKPIWLQQMS